MQIYNDISTRKSPFSNAVTVLDNVCEKIINGTASGQSVYLVRLDLFTVMVTLVHGNITLETLDLAFHPISIFNDNQGISCPAYPTAI